MENPIPIRTPLILDSSEKAFISGEISATGKLIEPFGETSFSEMLDILKLKAKTKKEEGAAFFIIDRIQSMAEIRAAVIACRKLALPIYVTVSVDEYGFTSTGSPALSFLIALQGMGISAFGLDCSHDTEKMLETIKSLAAYAKIPLIADFGGLKPNEIESYIIPSLKNGAEIIFGCFENALIKMEIIKNTLNSFDFETVSIEKQDTSLILASETQVFYLSADGIESSEPLNCSIDMADELLELSDTNTDVITIEVLSPDDAYQFSQNSHMARLPIMFKSENDLALKSALLMYHGRAMVDSSSEIPEEILKTIADKYDAVIY